MSSPEPDLEPTLAQLVPRPFDTRVVVILLSTAVLLTGSKYFGSINTQTLAGLAWALDACGVEEARSVLSKRFFDPTNPRSHLWRLHYWVAAHTVMYFVIPALLVKGLFRERLSDYGLKATGWYRRLWIYLAAFAVVLPCVWMVRGMAAFQRTYPFYKNAHASLFDFLAWELGYALQFFALEFFFRGFMIHGLKRTFGAYAILVMTIPYCMIHFEKPLPETLGAIIAGVFLGGLSLWTRSIWLGVLIHVSVAVSMDLAAMHYRGQWSL